LHEIHHHSRPVQLEGLTHVLVAVKQTIEHGRRGACMIRHRNRNSNNNPKYAGYGRPRPLRDGAGIGVIVVQARANPTRIF
ncbi:MAG TPA: hypothetical protein VGE93_20200, partial [Bryobacteraceae bacterium]